MSKSATRDTVCAVVVTYNRKNLLQECLKALLMQVYTVSCIIVVDNASTDGTPELLHAEGYLKEIPPVRASGVWKSENVIEQGSMARFIYVRMPHNIGGAGGFNYGVKVAYELGFDWIWLMDDDTIPSPSALCELLKAQDAVGRERVGFVSSKIVWSDGSPHFVNLPGLQRIVGGLPFNAFDSEGFLLVPYSHFVSLLIPRHAVAKAGYPIKEMFIWWDDVEYTHRIAQYELLGLYAMKSVAVHKTAKNVLADNSCDWRLFYGIRNSVYTHRRFGFPKFVYWVAWLLLKWIPSMPRGCRMRALKGLFLGLFFNPPIERPKGETS